jgi:hypothetical protein
MSKRETFFEVFGWAIMISSIALQPFSMSSSWFSSTLWISNILVFLVSLLAGLVMFDLEKIVGGYLFALVLSFLLFCFCVVLLPIVLGNVSLVALDIIFWGAVTIYAKFIFPIGIILALIGAFVGAFLRQALE